MDPQVQKHLALFNQRKDWQHSTSDRAGVCPAAGAAAIAGGADNQGIQCNVVAGLGPCSHEAAAEEAAEADIAADLARKVGKGINISGEGTLVVLLAAMPNGNGSGGAGGAWAEPGVSSGSNIDGNGLH